MAVGFEASAMTFESVFYIVIPGIALALLFLALTAWAAAGAYRAAVEARAARLTLEDQRAGRAAIHALNSLTSFAEMAPLLADELSRYGLDTQVSKVLASRSARHQLEAGETE